MRDGFEFVEVARDWLARDRLWPDFSARVLEALVRPGQRAGSALGSPAALFDTVMLRRSAGQTQLPELAATIVAWPGEALREPLQPGDVLLRRAFDHPRLSHVAVVVTGEALADSQIAETGFAAEAAGPGLGVHVLEGGPLSRSDPRGVIRRLAAPDGRLGRDHLVLRPDWEALSAGGRSVQTAGRAATGSLPWTRGNQIEYLLDAAQVFGSLRSDLLAVDRHGFIYLAFWQFHPDLVLDPRAPRPLRIGQVLGDQARRGARVCLLQWDFFTTLVGRLIGTTTLTAQVLSQRFGWLAPLLGAGLWNRFLNHGQITVDDTRQWVRRHAPQVQLAIAPFPDPGMPPGAGRLGPINLGSHHQKFVLIERPERGGGRRLVAYVLGLNATNEYQDDTLHGLHYPPTGSLRPRPWHDAGVRVVGPAAAQVEAEFVRRWNLQPGNASRRLVPVGISGPPPGNRQARFITTTTRHQPLRAALESGLRTARNSVYVEDQYFTNVRLADAIIDAALARQAANARLDIALLTNAPDEFEWRGVDAPLEVYRYVNFKNLELCTCQSIRVRGRTVTRAAGEDWRLQPHLSAAMHPRSQAQHWDVRNLYINTRAAGRITLGDINSVTGGIRPAYLLNPAGPRSVYIHAKLSIIDDHHMFIGSANHSVRSMDYDSEADLEVHDPRLARRIRIQMFDHTLGSTPTGSTSQQYATWHRIARRNAGGRVRPPRGRQVVLVEYPDRLPNLQQMAAALGASAGAMSSVVGAQPWLAPLTAAAGQRLGVAGLLHLMAQIYVLH